MNKLNLTVFKNVLNDTSKVIAINKNDDYTLLYYIMWYCTLHINKKILIVDSFINIEKLAILFNQICNINKVKFEHNFSNQHTFILNSNNIIFNSSPNVYYKDNNYALDIIVLPSILNTYKEFLQIIDDNYATNFNGQIFWRTNFNNNDTINWSYIASTIIKEPSNDKNCQQDYNKLILNVIQKQIELCSDLRFWQMLYNLGILKSVDNKEIVMKGLYVYDNFYLQSKDTYYQMIKHFKNMQMRCEKIYPNTLYVNENNEFIYCNEINSDFLVSEFSLLAPYKIYVAKEINTNDTYLINEFGMVVTPIISNLVNSTDLTNKEIKLGNLSKLNKE